MNNNPDKEKEIVDKSTDKLPGRNGAADFGTAILLMVFSVWAIFESRNYHSFSGDEIYIQPGFAPMLICAFIFIMAVFLLKDSLQGSSIKARTVELKNGIAAGLKSKALWNAVAGLGIFAIYIYVLLKYMPFWAATFIVLMATFTYIKAGTPVKRLIVSVAGTALVILIFQVIFAVPLP